MKLLELAEFLRRQGYDFIAITEHSYDVDQKSIDGLVEESKRLSSDNFIIIPGIEYRCVHDIDILGYGSTITCDSEDPVKVIEHIQSHGGVAVWAHPTIRNYPVDDNWIKKLDGYEIWNNGNDGKFLPQIRPLRMYQKYRDLSPNLKAFCGLDLHRKVNFRYISTIVTASTNDPAAILKALREGAFTTESRFFDVDSLASIGQFKKGWIYSARSILNVVRNVRNMLSG